MSIKTDELIDLSAVEAAIGRRILAIAASTAPINFRGPKNCTKGLSCGDTCLPQRQKNGKFTNCKKPLTPAQAAQHKALIGRVMGTVVGPLSKQEMDDLGIGGGPAQAPAAQAGGGAQKSSGPQSVKVPLQKEKLAELRADIVSEFGEELVIAAEANLEKLMAQSELFIALPFSSLDEIILKSKRFKSTVELGNKPEIYQKIRLETEEKMFDATYPDPADRAIYGYVAGSALEGTDHTLAAAYGDVKVRLKSEVKQRVSVTGEDSFSGLVPCEFGKPNLASFLENDANYGDEIDVNHGEKIDRIIKANNVSEYLGENNSYIEFQAHGRVTRDDIAEIYLKEGRAVSKELKAWADSNNVKISTYTDEEDEDEYDL